MPTTITTFVMIGKTLRVRKSWSYVWQRAGAIHLRNSMYRTCWRRTWSGCANTSSPITEWSLSAEGQRCRRTSGMSFSSHWCCTPKCPTRPSPYPPSSNSRGSSSRKYLVDLINLHIIWRVSVIRTRSMIKIVCSAVVWWPIGNSSLWFILVSDEMSVEWVSWRIWWLNIILRGNWRANGSVYQESYCYGHHSSHDLAPQHEPAAFLIIYLAFLVASATELHIGASRGSTAIEGSLTDAGIGEVGMLGTVSGALGDGEVSQGGEEED